MGAISQFTMPNFQNWGTDLDHIWCGNPPWTRTNSQTTVQSLTLISKIIEYVVRSQLTEYLSSNNILNPHQSAYHKHHSTETAPVYIHDHLINAVTCSSQKYPVFAFSTSDVLLFLDQRCGSHSNCQFLTHHWHWLSSVRSWKLCYSAEHTKH